MVEINIQTIIIILLVAFIAGLIIGAMLYRPRAF